MITRALLFPSSTFLSSRWWHRLAVVVLWAWLAWLMFSLFKILVIDPHASCVAAKYGFPGAPSDLDCGSNALSYAITNASNETLQTIVVTSAIVAIIFYVAALIPSLIYRVLLYIGKGRDWKDSPSAA